MLGAYKELTSSRSKMPPIESDRGFFVFDSPATQRTERLNGGPPCRVALIFRENVLDGGFQRGQVQFNDGPDPLRIDDVVPMTENVADARNVPPRDLRMIVSVALGNMPDGL